MGKILDACRGCAWFIEVLESGEHDGIPYCLDNSEIIDEVQWEQDVGVDFVCNFKSNEEFKIGLIPKEIK